MSPIPPLNYFPDDAQAAVEDFPAFVQESNAEANSRAAILAPGQKRVSDLCKDQIASGVGLSQSANPKFITSLPNCFTAR